MTTLLTTFCFVCSFWLLCQQLLATWQHAECCSSTLIVERLIKAFCIWKGVFVKLDQSCLNSRLRCAFDNVFKFPPFSVLSLTHYANFTPPHPPPPPKTVGQTSCGQIWFSTPTKSNCPKMAQFHERGGTPSEFCHKTNVVFFIFILWIVCMDRLLEVILVIIQTKWT